MSLGRYQARRTLEQIQQIEHELNERGLERVYENAWSRFRRNAILTVLAIVVITTAVQSVISGRVRVFEEEIPVQFELVKAKTLPDGVVWIDFLVKKTDTNRKTPIFKNIHAEIEDQQQRRVFTAPVMPLYLNNGELHLIVRDDQLRKSPGPVRLFLSFKGIFKQSQQVAIVHLDAA